MVQPITVQYRDFPLLPLTFQQGILFPSLVHVSIKHIIHDFIFFFIYSEFVSFSIFAQQQARGGGARARRMNAGGGGVRDGTVRRRDGVVCSKETGLGTMGRRWRTEQIGATESGGVSDQRRSMGWCGGLGRRGLNRARARVQRQ
jgi:hypothetical protein